MTPMEELYEKAKQHKREGKKVISLDYVLSKFEQEKQMYDLRRSAGA